MKNCERCDKKIPFKRLNVLPDTRLCVKCSQEVGGDYDLEVYEENLGDSTVSNLFIQKKPKVIEPIMKGN